MEISQINKRILQLIDYYTNRSVKKFAESIHIPQQTLNRLFNIDTRTGKYPLATTEILVAITTIYKDVDANWLLTGKGKMFRSPDSLSQVDSFPVEDKLLALIKEKDRKIEDLAKQIGHLEERIVFLNKKTSSVKGPENPHSAPANL